MFNLEMVENVETEIWAQNTVANFGLKLRFAHISYAATPNKNHSSTVMETHIHQQTAVKLASGPGVAAEIHENPKIQSLTLKKLNEDVQRSKCHLALRHHWLPGSMSWLRDSVIEHFWK